jgi:hypothetical protein
MKNYILGLFSLLFISSVSAQKNQQVTLNNGSVIKGEIMENNLQGVKIKTKDGSVWFYSKDEINTLGDYNPEWHNSKFYSSVTFGVMPSQQFSGSFHLINGYNLNSHWNLGLGVGLEGFGNRSYLPVFLHAKYNLLSTLSTPYITVISGYDLSLTDTEFNKGGFTTGIQLGLDHFFSQHVGVSTSVGYRYAYLKTQNSWWDDFVTVREVNRFEMRFGLIFK